MLSFDMKSLSTIISLDWKINIILRKSYDDKELQSCSWYLGLFDGWVNFPFRASETKRAFFFFFFLSIWVFISRKLTNNRTSGEGEGVSLTPHCHFHSLHRHLDINRANTAESSPLHIASSRNRIRNLYIPSQSC